MILLESRADIAVAFIGLLLGSAIVAGIDGLFIQAGIAFVIAMSAWIAWTDARTFTIPDGALLAIAIVGAALRLNASADPAEASLRILIDLLVCGGALFALREAYYRMRGYDGLGFGDVKLAATGGVLIGAVNFSHALLAASLFGLVLLLARPRNGGDLSMVKLPFGLVLAPACAAVFIVSTAGW
ncbi:prepilin peptidase [Rhizobium sp. YIM 134829]|uniref:prepilin peptidase n=1 Tax=Rhizobium sp. YIM 134829 TaxID=3390453 RepID=UPI0039796CAA